MVALTFKASCIADRILNENNDSRDNLHEMVQNQPHGCELHLSLYVNRIPLQDQLFLAPIIEFVGGKPHCTLEQRYSCFFLKIN